MRTGLTISVVGHTALMLWGVVTFVVAPNKTAMTDSLPVEVVSTAEFSQIMAGSKTAPKSEVARPVAEKIGDRTPTDDPTAKVTEKKEIKAAAEEVPPPPMPEPKPQPVKPPAAAEKKPPEPKRDLIADALRKEEAKKPDLKPEPKPKPEPKTADARVPTPPKKAPKPQPKFDPKKVEALLDKRVPQRQAAAADIVNDTPTLGLSTGLAAQLSQNELDALRARLAQLWNPPAGATNPQELVVTVRIKLKQDGTLAGPPIVLSSGQSPLFMASRDSAMRAVFRGQPFDMLKPEHYEQWKDVEITFDPRDMVRG